MAVLCLKKVTQSRCPRVRCRHWPHRARVPDRTTHDPSLFSRSTPPDIPVSTLTRVSANGLVSPLGRFPRGGTRRRHLRRLGRLPEAPLGQPNPQRDAGDDSQRPAESDVVLDCHDRATSNVRSHLVHRHSKMCGFWVQFSDPSMVWMSRHQIMEDRHGYSLQEVHHPPERG